AAAVEELPVPAASRCGAIVMMDPGHRAPLSPALLPAQQSLARWLSRPLISLSVLVHALVLIGVIVHPERWLLAVLVILGNHLLLVALSLWPRSTWMDA